MLSDAGGPADVQYSCPCRDVSEQDPAAEGGDRPGFPVLGPENALLRHVLESIDRAVGDESIPHHPEAAVGDAVRPASTVRAEGYNPLVLVGRDGCGKSHCIDFLERRWRSGSKGRITRWDDVSLVRELGPALATDQLHRIHQRFVTAELVLVEGLDRVANREVLSALPHLLDRACEAGALVIVTLGHFPAEMSRFPAALVSRLSAGLIVAVRMPEQESRRSVVRAIADRIGIALDEASLARLAGADIPTDTILSSMEILAGGGCPRVEPRHVTDIIAGTESPRSRPSIRKIVATTAKHYGLPVTDLLGPSRHKNVANARSTAIYLARRLTGKSLVEIGTFFGGRDHTTVLHSIRITRRRAESDPAWQRDIDHLLSRLA